MVKGKIPEPAPLNHSPFTRIAFTLSSIPKEADGEALFLVHKIQASTDKHLIITTLQ